MKKLTALSLALLLALSPAAAGALAMEQLHPPAQTEPPALSQEEPEGETTSTQPEAPEGETTSMQSEAPEGETTSMQSEEELPVWTEVSTIDELCAAGRSADHIRLTADLTASDPNLQFYIWTPTALDMNGHHIQIKEGGWFSFGGRAASPVVITGDGGEEGAFRVAPGGRLELEYVDASRLTGLLARQAEGGCLVVSEVTARPEQIAYAQAPVLYQLRASFAALPLGLSQEELAAQLPEPEVFVNYQGQMSMMLSIPADRLSWDIEENWEDISAGRRTVLHARPNGPIAGDGWPESGLPPTLFAPVSCELAILVDGAAIGYIIDRHTVQGSHYELYLLFPDRVRPEGLPLSGERGLTGLEFSLDGGETWLSVTAGGEGLDTDLLYAELYDERDEESQEPCAQLGFYRMNVTFSVRAWADYQGEGYAFRLYTDTLTLSPEGAHVNPGAGGSRGGTVDLLPTPPDPPDTEPDPPEPVTPPVEDAGPSEPVTPPVEDAGPSEPVTPPVEDAGPSEPVTPPVEDAGPSEPVTPPVEDAGPSEPVTPPVEAAGTPEPVTPPLEDAGTPEPVTPPLEDAGPSEPVLPVTPPPQEGREASDPPVESSESPSEPADSAPNLAQTAPPDGQTQHTAIAPSPEKQTASALPSPAVQVLAGAAVTSTLVTATAAANPAAILNWLRRLFHKL